MKKFVINEKEYVAKPFDFNMVCDLEDCGFEIQELGSKKMKAARAYFAVCADMSPEQAGKEIEKHAVNGGNLTDLMIAMGEEMEKSDFFRALTETAETENTENQEEA